MSHKTFSKVFIYCSLTVMVATAAYGQSSAANRTKTVGTLPADSSSFLNQIIEINQAEADIGRLAFTKAADKRVKDFAAMMVKDHSAGLKKLQSLPGGQNNTVKLTNEHEMLKSRLSALNGKQFDREYIEAMVSGHRETLGLFEKYASDSATRTATTSANTGDRGGSNAQNSSVSGNTSNSSPQLDSVARELLPTIKTHLRQAETIQNALSRPAK